MLLYTLKIWTYHRKSTGVLKLMMAGFSCFSFKDLVLLSDMDHENRDAFRYSAIMWTTTLTGELLV